MAINSETARAHDQEPALACCRFEAGSIIEPSNLEDPALFADLKNSGLLALPEGVLTIGQVLGAKLSKRVEALTPLTVDMVENSFDKEAVAKETTAEVETVAVAAMGQTTSVVSFNNGMMKISIGEGKNINLKIPMHGQATPLFREEAKVISQVMPQVAADSASIATAQAQEAEVIRSLIKKHFKIEAVLFGKETAIEGTTLTIREGIEAEAVETNDLVVDMKVDIITPEDYNTYSETIMEAAMNLTVELRSKTLLNTGHLKPLEEGHFKAELTQELYQSNFQIWLFH